MEIIKELETLKKIHEGYSIARFGDGELRVSIGASVGHQKAERKLTKELQHILQEPTKCLVGVPYIDPKSPKVSTWKHYCIPAYQKHFNPNKQYYSAFITRPDSAPWIDTPEYWDLVKKLWQGKDVVTVRGSRKTIMPENYVGAKSVKEIITLPEDAYSEIDSLEREIESCGKDRLIFLSVGITATVLAWRLAEKGHQAIDLGHLGMFMKRQGLFGKDTVCRA